MAVPQSQAVELGISLGMSEDEVLGYKAQFDATDLDGGGTISNDELKQVLRKCGVSVTDAEVKRYILEFDTDGDGVLDFAEFLGMMHKFNQGPSEKDMRKAMFEVCTAFVSHTRAHPHAFIQCTCPCLPTHLLMLSH